MRASIHSWSGGKLTPDHPAEEPDPGKTQLVLGFGARKVLTGEAVYGALRIRYPVAEIILCSTSGEIFGDHVQDDTVSITAIEFQKSRVKTSMTDIREHQGDSYRAGIALVSPFERTPELTSILVLSDGGMVNGSELVKGINQVVGTQAPVSGGLAGDGTDFHTTVVGLNMEPVPGKMVAIAFYGKDLRITHGTMGGWEMFGPERTVTRSVANRLFEINQENALALYRKYLGDYADELPGSALLFPLSVRLSPDSEPVVRTILSIDPETDSMVFAGDIPEGTQVRFMKANFDKLIDAASDAARNSLQQDTDPPPRLALLISCVGRKIILGSRIDEEVEAIREVFGRECLLSGFYSYGEISPFAGFSSCELHNQTMTITTFNEK